MPPGSAFQVVALNRQKRRLADLRAIRKFRERQDQPFPCLTQFASDIYHGNTFQRVSPACTRSADFSTGKCHATVAAVSARRMRRRRDVSSPVVGNHRRL